MLDWLLCAIAGFELFLGAQVQPVYVQTVIVSSGPISTADSTVESPQLSADIGVDTGKNLTFDVVPCVKPSPAARRHPLLLFAPLPPH